MQGETIHPLNVLKDSHPELHAQEIAKYAGREHLLEKKIPGTNWLWNDVVHLSAIHPRELNTALREAGGNPPLFESFEIDPTAHNMNAENTVFYFNPIAGEEYSEPFDSEKIIGYANIPEATRQYYRDAYAREEKPFLFHGIPHILHKGSIDIKKVKRVTS